MGPRLQGVVAGKVVCSQDLDWGSPSGEGLRGPIVKELGDTLTSGNVIPQVMRSPLGF